MKYVILDADDVAEIVFSEISENSLDTLRYNVAKTEVIVKYEGDEPPFLHGKDTYSHSQILEITRTATWSYSPPPTE